MSDYVRSVASAPEEARLVLELLDRAVLMADADSDDLELVGVPDDEEEPAVPSETNESATGETGEPRPAPSPQDAAWAAFHALLPAVPSPAPVDVDEFKLSVNGQFSFMLLQNDAPGQRVRGRSVTVFAVAGPDDESVTLIASPEMDLTELEQGWEVGSRYNIIASKVVRGQIAVPEGSQVLSAEVLAWDEDDKSLIFRKKIKIEGR
jgi:hypothetical protein